MKAIQLRMARAAVGWGVRELAKRPASPLIPSPVSKMGRTQSNRRWIDYRMRLRQPASSSPMVISPAYASRRSAAALRRARNALKPTVAGKASAAKSSRRLGRSMVARLTSGGRAALLDQRLSWPAWSSSTRTAAERASDCGIGGREKDRRATKRPRKRLANAFGSAIDGRHPRSAHQRRLDIHDMFMLYSLCVQLSRKEILMTKAGQASSALIPTAPLLITDLKTSSISSATLSMTR